MGTSYRKKEMTGITALGHAVTAVYAGARLAWQAVRSCFGAGWWNNVKPWDNTEGWKN